MKLKPLLAAITAAALLQVPGAHAKDTPGRPDQIKIFQDSLTQGGLDVGAGNADTMDWAEAYCRGTMENGGYVNKAPYVRLRVPVSSRDATLTEAFQLRPDEAIVLIGLTPPRVNYFGYHAFLWNRAYPGKPREPMIATLGDTVNNATIHTIGPDPFSRPVVLIFTPDRRTDARIRAALHRAGYPAATINTIVFPAAIVNLGFGDRADELKIVMRIGQWDVPEVGKFFMENLSSILKVFRVTPHTPAVADSFPVPPLRVRGTGQSEIELMKKLGQLRQGIIDANAAYYEASEFPSRPNWYEGYDYIQRRVNPGADTRDAFFLSAGYLPEYGSPEEFALADGEFLMVYGPNHVNTGKATYMNVNVYASKTAKLSIGQVFDGDLAGTAWPYLPAGDSAADMFYAYKISRDCAGESNCLTLSADDYNTPDHPACLAIDSATVLGVIFRMYLEPATSVGAAMPEILYDHMIKFSPRH